MTLDKSTARIQEMFGEIAGRYDFLNRLLSLGIDQSWRRKTVKWVPPVGEAPILDVCTGTADLALAYWRASKGKTPIVGTDFCLPMLAIGREKCCRAGAIPRSHAPRGNAASDAPRPSGETTQNVEPGVPTQSVGTRGEFQPGITLLQADTLRLPFPDDVFQIVSVAFGLRNLSRHRRRPARNGSGVPIRRAGGDPGVLDAHRLAAGGNVRLVFPARVAAHRSGTGSKQPGRLQLSSAERRPVSPGRGVGRADASGGARRSEVLAVYVRSGDAVCWKQGVRDQGPGVRK